MFLRSLLILVLIFLPLFADEFKDRAKEAWGLSKHDRAYETLRFLPGKIEATAEIARKLYQQGYPLNKAIAKAKSLVSKEKPHLPNRFQIDDHSNLKKIIDKPFEITFFSRKF